MSTYDKSTFVGLLINACLNGAYDEHQLTPTETVSCIVRGALDPVLLPPSEQVESELVSHDVLLYFHDMASFGTVTLDDLAKIRTQECVQSEPYLYSAVMFSNLVQTNLDTLADLSKYHKSSFIFPLAISDTVSEDLEQLFSVPLTCDLYTPHYVALEVTVTSHNEDGLPVVDIAYDYVGTSLAVPAYVKSHPHTYMLTYALCEHIITPPT